MRLGGAARFLVRSRPVEVRTVLRENALQMDLAEEKDVVPTGQQLAAGQIYWIGIEFSQATTFRTAARQFFRVDDLPLTFRLGVAYDFVNDKQNRLTTVLEAKHPNDNQQQASVGAEYSYQEKYFLRGGYKLNYEEQGLTFGGGVHAPLGDRTVLSIDYAWSDFGRLESVHRFSVGFNF